MAVYASAQYVRSRVSSHAPSAPVAYPWNAMCNRTLWTGRVSELYRAFEESLCSGIRPD